MFCEHLLLYSFTRKHIQVWTSLQGSKLKKSDKWNLVHHFIPSPERIFSKHVYTCNFFLYRLNGIYLIFTNSFWVSSKLDIIYVYGGMEHLQILVCVIVHHNQNKITSSKFNSISPQNTLWYTLQKNLETSDQ